MDYPINLEDQISESIHNYVHLGKNQTCQEVEVGYISVKIYDACMTPGTEIMEIIQKIQHFNYHELWYIF